jgi:hypothetical protein
MKSIAFAHIDDIIHIGLHIRYRRSTALGYVRVTQYDGGEIITVVILGMNMRGDDE